MSTKPDAWTLSPQLTAAPELWRDLDQLYPMWDVDGVDGIRDIVHNIVIPASVVGSGGNIKKELTGKGLSLLVDNGLDSKDGKFYILPSIRISGSFTLWALAKVRVMSSDRASDQDQALFNVNSENHAIYYNNNGNIQMFDGNGVVGSFTYEADTWYSTVNLGETGKGTNSNTYKLYIDGVNVGSGSAFEDANHLRLFEGKGFTTGGRTFDGFCLIVGIWNRHLTEAEIKQLYDDPFAMLRPAGF